MVDIDILRAKYKTAFREKDEKLCEKLDDFWLCSCNAPFDDPFCFECGLPRGLKNPAECTDLLLAEQRKDDVKL